MVEYETQLDSIFLSLADTTRRDMLRLLNVYGSLSIGEIASHYRLTFAGVSKHVKVLESARLVVKKRKGQQRIVHLSPSAFKSADEYLKNYEAIWNERFDRLDKLLKEEK